VEAWETYYTLDFTGRKQEALAESQKAGILTPVGSYIVVEDEAQRKMLQVKQLQAKDAHAGMDFMEQLQPTPANAPLGIVLIIGFGIFCLLRKRKV